MPGRHTKCERHGVPITGKFGVLVPKHAAPALAAHVERLPSPLTPGSRSSQHMGAVWSRVRAPALHHPAAAATHIGARVQIFSALSARGCDPSGNIAEDGRIWRGRARHDSTGIQRAGSF